MLRNRIIVGLLWIVSLVGITFYGGTISYGFFIAVTLLPLLSLCYLLSVRLRFSIYQKLEGKTFVSNHAIPYFFTLQDEAKFAFAGVKVFFYSDFSSLTELRDGIEYELFPDTGITRDTTLICKYRGSYNVGIRSVEITDFLRLFRMRYKNKEPLEVFIQAVENVKPKLEVKSRRVGGATYQVPLDVPAERQVALAMRWIVTYSQAKKGKSMMQALASELLDAFDNTGSSIKKKDDTHKMAQANKAFAHYRW